MECMSAQPGPRFYSHPKDFFKIFFKGSGVKTDDNSKVKILQTGGPQGGWNPRCCMTQDSESSTLQTVVVVVVVTDGVIIIILGRITVTTIRARAAAAAAAAV